MATPMKSLRTVGIVLVFIGIITLTISGANEEMDGSGGFQYQELVRGQYSGDFTTNYNSSWSLEIMPYFEYECESVELEIRDSNNIIVYNDEVFCNQYENGKMLTFNHQVNETYTFQSNTNVDISIYYENLEHGGLLEFLGFLSCCFGVMITGFAGVVGSAAGNNQSVGIMPAQMGGGVPIHTNINNQGNVQMYQTHMTQPTIQQEVAPQTITIVNNEKRQETIEEFNPPEEKKSNFWDNIN